MHTLVKNLKILIADSIGNFSGKRKGWEVDYTNKFRNLPQC